MIVEVKKRAPWLNRDYIKSNGHDFVFRSGPVWESIDTSIWNKGLERLTYKLKVELIELADETIFSDF